MYLTLLDHSTKQHLMLFLVSNKEFFHFYYKIFYFYLCIIIERNIMEFGSFPKNLAYNVKSLSGFSKTVVKLTPTPNGPVEAGSTFKVRLPPNTLIDLRTISLFYEGTCTATGGNGWLRFPRLSIGGGNVANHYHRLRYKFLHRKAKSYEGQLMYWGVGGL